MFSCVEDAAMDLLSFMREQIAVPAYRVEDGFKFATPEYYREVAQRIFEMCFQFGDEAIEPLMDIIDVLEQHGLARPAPSRAVRKQLARL